MSLLREAALVVLVKTLFPSTKIRGVKRKDGWAPSTAFVLSCWRVKKWRQINQSITVMLIATSRLQAQPALSGLCVCMCVCMCYNCIHK